MALDLICLGNLTLDDIVLPTGETHMASFGGDAVYAAQGASFWSNGVEFVAPIGNDFPPHNLEKLQTAGWDLRGLPRRDLPSIRNWVVYEFDGSRTWITRSNPNNFNALSPTITDIPPAFLAARAFLVLAMDLSVTEQLITSLQGQPGLLALDPQEDYTAVHPQRVLDLVAHLDIFLPSRDEVHFLLGHKDYKQAAREFAALGCQIVVIKLGAEGALIYDSEQDRFWRTPVYPVDVVDTTGAGDAFCGGFMASFVKNGNLEWAGHCGAVSASFAIEGQGLTYMLQAKRQEAEQRLNEIEQNFR